MPKSGQLLRALTPPLLKRTFVRALQSFGYQLVNVQSPGWRDGLNSIHQPRFLSDPRFIAAYRRGVEAGHGVDPGFPWRIHMALWAASVAAKLPGDFVECGVNAGFVSSAILERLDWASMRATFYLVDTFAGPPLQQYSEDEIKAGRLHAAAHSIAAGAYVTDLDRVRRNFAGWDRIEIVQGSVPDILPAVAAHSIAFLHLDMNSAAPEVAALRHFWPRLLPGAVVLFDDYAYRGYEVQGDALEAAARELGAEIAALPTGQGILIR